MAKRGRPTKYRADFPAKISEACANGATLPEVADILGVAPRTVDYWKLKHADFLRAIKENKDLADDLVEASLFNRAIGYTAREDFVMFDRESKRFMVHEGFKHIPPDPTSAIFWLKNRRPEKWREKIVVEENANGASGEKKEKEKVDFDTFCANASYPKPYPKQHEMREFGFNEVEPRMLLGARGYGKTDYITIAGAAYAVYLDPTETILIITKSKSRNSAIMGEIAALLKCNGISLEKENSSELRVEGLQGKDHSVEAITIKTSMRGRHPRRIIMDDPVTEEDVSEAMRVLVKRKYNEAMKLVSNVLVIGQPAHKHDLYAELRPMVRKLEMPYGTIPELDHDLEAQRLAGVDEDSIQKSYFLNAQSDDSSGFEKLKYLDQFPMPGDSVAFIDPSFEGGDYTAMSIIRAYMQGVAVVGFVWKKSWNDSLDDIVQKVIKYSVKKLCFETNSLGTMPLNILRKALPEYVGVSGRKSNTNKHSRILAAGTYAQIIHMSKESDRTYIDQVVKYEYDAKNDDAPDSLASGLEWIGLIRGKI